MTDQTPSPASEPTPTPTPTETPTPTPTEPGVTPVVDPLTATSELNKAADPAAQVTAAAPAEDGSKADEPADDPKPANAALFGAPETYELTMPEGVEIDAEALAEAEPILRELGLSNEGANKLVPLAAAMADRGAAMAAQQMETAILAERAAWVEQAQSDPELGGNANRYQETLALAAKGLDLLGFKAAHKDGDGKDVPAHPLRAFFDATGLGNHPEMIRVFRRVGERLSEPSDLPRPGGAGGAKSPLDVLYPDTAKGD